MTVCVHTMQTIEAALIEVNESGGPFEAAALIEIRRPVPGPNLKVGILSILKLTKLLQNFIYIISDRKISSHQFEIRIISNLWKMRWQ